MKVLHLYLYGAFTDEPSESWAKEFGDVRLIDVVKALNEAPEAEEVFVHINSPGGYVNVGFAVYDALVNSGKKITTQVEGFCGSIATVVALAGSTRLMWENSEFFIHSPWNFAMGNAEELSKVIDALKEAEDKIADFYVSKTGGDRDHILDLMKAEAKMSASSALEMNFITEIVKPLNASSKFKHILNKMSKKPASQNPTPEETQNIVDRILNGVRDILKRNKVKDEEKPKAMSITLEGDAGVLEIETENDVPAKGDKATIGGEPASGTYTAADGAVIVCEEGVITEYTPAPDDSEANADTEELNRLREENENLRNEITAAKNDVQKMAADVRSLGRMIKSSYVPPADNNNTNNRSNPNDKAPKNRVQKLTEERAAAKK